MHASNFYYSPMIPVDSFSENLVNKKSQIYLQTLACAQ